MTHRLHSLSTGDARELGKGSAFTVRLPGGATP